MYNPKGVSLLETPWHVNTDDDFKQAFRACKIVVAVSVGAHAAVLLALAFDRRPHGSAGRALTRSIPGTPLQAGDRLEPTATLADAANFERINTFPARVTFWRPSSATLAHFRSPLWDAPSGLESHYCPCSRLGAYT